MRCDAAAGFAGGAQPQLIGEIESQLTKNLQKNVLPRESPAGAAPFSI